MSKIHPFLTNGRQSDQSIWEIASSSVGGSGVHPVGTRAVLEDGRVFYYARNQGAAIVAGNLLMAELATDEFSGLAVDAEVVGTETIAITTKATAIVVNEYAEGYVHVLDELGEGVTYQIKSHPAIGATTEFECTLHDPINVAFHADTTLEMTKSLWSDVIISAGGFAHVPAGVSSTAVIAGSTNPQYFWCQTWGPASVWCDEGVTIGQAVVSGTTAGQVETQNAIIEKVVGQLVGLLAVAGEYHPVFLTIAP